MTERDSTETSEETTCASAPRCTLNIEEVDSVIGMPSLYDLCSDYMSSKLRFKVLWQVLRPLHGNENTSW